MGITIFRPGQRLVIPSPGVQIWAPRVASVSTSTWWDNNGAISGCVAAYQPKGAASLAASYINLANPGTNNAAPGVAPAWDATSGWKGDASSAYLVTGIVPAANWTFVVRFSNGDGGNLYGSIAGGNDGKDFFIDSMSSTIRYANGGRLIKAAFTSGVAAVAGGTAYRNGIAETGSMSAAVSTTTDFVILARKASTIINSFSAAHIQAFAVYNVALTDTQVATITAAMQAL